MIIKKFIQLVSCSFIVLILGALPVPENAFADISFTSPGASDVSITSAPDYATDIIFDPWNMDDAQDLSDFVSEELGTGLTNITFDNEMFNFDIVDGSNAFFYMISPGQCSSNALGKTGLTYPVDSTKYRYLTFRMYSDTTDSMHVVWYSGCGALTNYRRSAAIEVGVGWQTYVIDMESLSYITDSGESRSWSAAAEITGLQIQPGGIGASASTPLSRKIDWMMLSGTPGAGSSHNVAYTVAADGGSDRYSVFIDDDADPFNGVVQWLKQDSPASDGASTVAASSNYLFPAPYVVGGFLSDDFMTLYGEPWDFSDISDVQNNSVITSAAVSSGTFSGTTADASTLVQLNFRGEDFDGNSFDNVCIRMNAGGVGQGGIFWNGGGVHTFNVSAGMQTYSLDLSGTGSWTGNSAINTLYINPIGTGGVNFSIEWVAVRRNGCGSADTLPTVRSATGSLVVNTPPVLTILQPDKKGGLDFASSILQNPWNFGDADDIDSLVNISSARIYPNNYIYNRQGDFFCATNEEGNLDPYHNFLDEAVDSSQRIPARFRNVSISFYVDRAQNVGGGSTLRIIACNYERDGIGECVSGDDTFYKGQEWVTLTQDMTSWQLEELLHPNPPQPIWDDSINQFRIDIHEFEAATTYCIDKVEVRTDDMSDDTFTIAYALDDSDSATGDVSVSFYYTTTAGATSGGTAIATGLALTRDSRTVDFDTSGLAAGTYYIYGVATDTQNETRFPATGRLLVDHTADLRQNVSGPALVTDQPTEGRSVYKGSGMVVSGYALDDVELALVEVLIDGTYLDSFVPARFSKAARTAYSTNINADSAGFFETIDLTSVSNGAHVVTVRACDTAGNCTTDTINVDVQSGNDPSPVPTPAQENERGVALGNTSLSIQSSATKSGELSLSLVNVDTCGGTMTLYGAKSSKNITKRKKLTSLYTFTAGTSETTKTLTASGLPFMKKPKNKVTRSGKIKKGNKKLYFAIDCNGTMGATKTINFKTIKRKQASGKSSKGKYLQAIQAAITE